MGLPQFEMHSSEGGGYWMQVLSWTAGLPESIKKWELTDQTWNHFWNSSLKTQKREFTPCVLAVAIETCIISNLGYNGGSQPLQPTQHREGRALLTLDTVKVALATLTQNVAVQVSTFLLFFFLFLKPGLSERIAKIPKLRFYSPNLILYLVKQWTENLGLSIEIVRGPFWKQRCSEYVYKGHASLVGQRVETSPGVLKTSSWTKERRVGCLLPLLAQIQLVSS